ncbi:hypothetical protein GIB67_019305, partial [Kingdonia uniflora]
NLNYDSHSNDRTPPQNFGPRVQVVRTTLNLVRTTLVKISVSPRFSWIMALPFRRLELPLKPELEMWKLL